MISYNTELSASQEDIRELKKILEYQRTAYNACSKVLFSLEKRNIVILHRKFYKNFRNSQPQITSQVVITAQKSCLANYRAAKSNKHKLSNPIEKKNLSMQLDKRLFSDSKCEFGEIKITTANLRRKFKLTMFPKLENLLKNYQRKDPLIFEKDGRVFISMIFDVSVPLIKQKLALGVDLGKRVIAACSDGRLIKAPKQAGQIRQTRFLKRQLQKVGSRTSRKHLKHLRQKERNQSKNLTHSVANEILKTQADTIVLENLKGIKKKKHKFQNKNSISQVSFYELRRIVTYKANNRGKSVVLVNPAFTSQTDSISGKRKGERRGRRFYSENGLIYDSDINAARNIGIKSKLPVSYGDILDGQGVVIHPHVNKSKI